MEKFAVDLDKVLDEFEFNEDCAEQVASSVIPEGSTSSTLRKHSLGGSSDSGELAHDRQCALEERPKSKVATSRLDETLDIRKKCESKHDDSESINDFYNRGRNLENKVQQKQYADFMDGEPVSLTFHNDISQKLVQKKQNESLSGVAKNQNSYDKKLNQPNIKPSVSNVFSSLNEYINAPTCSDSPVDLHSKTGNNVAAKSCTSAVETGGDDNPEEANVNVEKMSKAQPARYQNILLPVKLETNLSCDRSAAKEKRNFSAGNETPSSVTAISGNSSITLNSAGISIISGGVSVTSGAINVNSAISAAIPESTMPEKFPNIVESSPKSAAKVKHVYENVYVPTEVENRAEISSAPSKSENNENKTQKKKKKKHVYENVDFEEKDASYQRIYIGNDKYTSESSIDEENAVKVGHVAPERENSGSELEGSSSSAAIAERKPLVGFSTIDDLSEEELNKYLAELEAEERAIEGKPLYENVPYAEPPREDAMLRQVVAGASSRALVEDEDANEAPIFETVTIGELPSVSEEKLQEKAKKFPVIDYGKQQQQQQQGTFAAGGSGGAPIDPRTTENAFLEKKRLEKNHVPASAISEARIKEEKSKKLGDASIYKRDGREGRVESQTSVTCEEKVERTLPAIGAEIASSDDFRVGVPHNFNRNSIIIDNSIGNRNSESGCPVKNFTIRSADSRENSVESFKVESTSEESAKADFTVGDADCPPLDNYLHTETNIESANVDCTARKERQSDVLTEFAEANVESAASETGNSLAEENATTGLPIVSSENGFADREEANENSEENVEDKPSRPQTLNIISTISMDANTTIGSPGATPASQERPEAESSALEEVLDPSPDASDNSSMESGMILGKQPPFWIPDSEAPNCMLCDVKFNVIKRRHHCRACGKVLCNKCCGMKYRLEYQGNIDSRVCSPCYQLLVKAEQEHGSGDWTSSYGHNSPGNVNSPQGRQPNPNNPMEYCSTIPPLQQLAGGLPPPPSVMVPVGVLKREGSSKQRSEGQKSVMFSDGIRPGCDLTELDTSWDLKPPYRKVGNKRTPTSGQTSASAPVKRQNNVPPLDPNTNSYIPHDLDMLPPTVTIHKGQISYHEVTDSAALYKSLKNDCEPPVMFAINRNLYAYVKITNLNCCVNRICWNVTSRGLACVGQDEIILLVETLPDETQIPKDLLVHINQIYVEAIKGNTLIELGVSIHQGGNFLGSREHAGFLFIRQTFQCLQKIVIPPAPFLVGLLVHRWETPWAKVFPLRLVLRLGAEYRYYPCPLVSVRFRDAVYFEIGHTIMKVLADFRNFAYTLPGVRGLAIHMQDRTTDVLFPKNRYDQVIKGLNNSNDHVLAFASNFSVLADSHLVCIQTNTGDESSYQTQAINIHNKPRKVTGASFVVINGALKSSMGLSAKSSIVEDGLMVQIMPEKMEALKAALKNMQDFSIGCGIQGAPEPDETVNIKWVDNDVQFNLGVKSPIDGKMMDGVPSIRVHNGTDYMGTSKFIRWTEVFIIKSDDHPTGVHDPVDINKLSESIARATCAALVKLLDLLATAGLTKLGVRTMIHPDNVGYEAGSEGTRLPPIYMNSLDNELIQVLHKAAQSSQDTNTVLELIFHVLDD